MVNFSALYLGIKRWGNPFPLSSAPFLPPSSTPRSFLFSLPQTFTVCLLCAGEHGLRHIKKSEQCLPLSNLGLRETDQPLSQLVRSAAWLNVAARFTAGPVCCPLRTVVMWKEKVWGWRDPWWAAKELLVTARESRCCGKSLAAMLVSLRRGLRSQREMRKHFSKKLDVVKGE